MASLPKISSIFSWILSLIPLYIFVLAPLTRQLLPSSPSGDGDGDDSLDVYGFDDDYAQHHQAQGLNSADDNFISPDDGAPLHCPAANGGRYQVHILRREPLVIYIEGFLSDWEADHLIDVSLGKYTPSIVFDGVTEKVDPATRLSDRALLDRDEVVRCIEERARSFQGWRPHLYIERMWAQRYNASGHYRHHYDWAGTAAHGGDRVSTFMVYLDANCTGGGTNFPRLRMPADRAKWCRFLECDDKKREEAGETGKDATRPLPQQQQGITFKPIKGNAIFWENLRADGTGYLETWHAAFPVTSGTKVGLNIWSWYQPRRAGQGKAR